MTTNERLAAIADYMEQLENFDDARFLRSLQSETRAASAVAADDCSKVRADIIEEVAKAIEVAPLTYFGPDPSGMRNLRYLLVCAIRDFKVPR